MPFREGSTRERGVADEGGALEIGIAGEPQPISLASIYRLLAEARKEGRLGEVRRVVTVA